MSSVQKYQKMSIAEFEALKTSANSDLKNAGLQFAVVLYHHYKGNSRALPFWLDRVANTPSTQENKPYKGKAQLMLGEHYCWLAKKFSGLSDCRDNFYISAVDCFSKAAKEAEGSDAANAAMLCGYCYYEGGHGVKKDYSKAINAFGVAASKFKKLGDEKSCADALFKIARCYFEGGFELEQDKPKAIDCLKKAAQCGHVEAISLLKQLPEGL